MSRITALTAIIAVIAISNLASAYTFNNREYTQIEGQWYQVYLGVNYAVVGTEIWVWFQSGTSETQIQALNASLGGETIKVNPLGTYLIQSTTEPAPDPLDFMQSYLNSSYVEKGKNNVEWKFDWPDDPGATDDVDYIQRYLVKPDNDLYDNTINPGPAWELTTGNPAIKVGILDSGILFSHSELRENLWQNQGEDTDMDGTIVFLNDEWVLDPDDINDIDDDQNGYVDDLIGINTRDNFGDPHEVGDALRWWDECWHGTAVTSIIAARSNNGSQFAGIAGGSDDDPGVSIVFCKMVSGFTDDQIIEGLIYMLTIGVDVINMSFSGPNDNDDIADCLDDAYQAGIILVGSTGNDGADEVNFPARNENVIAVGASSDNTRSGFANFGDDLHLTAPSGFTVGDGDDDIRIIYTACASQSVFTGREIEVDPENDSEDCIFGGTSGSAPQVTGVCALILSQDYEKNNNQRTLTIENVREILFTTAKRDVGDEEEIEDVYDEDRLYGSWSNEMGYGELDAGNAVQYGNRYLNELDNTGQTTWVMISTWLMPYYTEDNSLDDEDGLFLTFDEIVGCFNVIEDVEDNYWQPGIGNTIPDFDYKKGYYINLTDDADWVSLGKVPSPDEEDEWNSPLTEGWGIVAYFPEFDLDAEDAFISLWDPEDEQIRFLEVAQDSWGGFYVPSYPFNCMADLTRGFGYKVYVDDNCELDWPDEIPANIKREHHPLANSPEHFTFSRTNNFHSVILESVRVENVECDSLDEIGAFNDNDICIGASVYTGENRIGLAIWKDDPYTEEVDGYSNEGMVFLRYWDRSANMEIGEDTLNLQGNLNSLQLFSAHNLTIGNPSILPGSFFLQQNFPNPFNSTTRIEYDLNSDCFVNISIFDLSGRSVRTLQNGVQRAGNHFKLWDGADNDGIQTASGVYLYKAVFTSEDGSNYRFTKRLHLIR